jgi:hypothetical protein
LALQFANVARHAGLNAAQLASSRFERTHVRDCNQCFELQERDLVRHTAPSDQSSFGMDNYAQISLYLGFFYTKNTTSKSPAMQIEPINSSRLRFEAPVYGETHEIV